MDLFPFVYTLDMVWRQLYFVTNILTLLMNPICTYTKQGVHVYSCSEVEPLTVCVYVCMHMNVEICGWITSHLTFSETFSSH